MSKGLREGQQIQLSGNDNLLTKLTKISGTVKMLLTLQLKSNGKETTGNNSSGAD